jgi:hypothetical protein
MAAGLGFKDFTTGEVLTAADVDGYLMQGIWVFASTAARDAAVTSPQEGNFAFTKDTNGLWYYDGAAWVASGATGDIEGVTAGVGISGGGTSGTVTVTNSMATEIDAKGDLIGGTGADTFARLAVGANDTVLTADSSTATGLKWATPAAGSSTFAGASATNAGGTTLSVANNTYVAVTFATENFDTNTYHSTSSNTSRMTIPSGKGGYYQVNGSIRWNNNTSGERDLYIYKNGVEYARGIIKANDQYPTSIVTAIISVVATDYLELFVYHNSGITLAAETAQSSGCLFSIGYLGA